MRAVLFLGLPLVLALAGASCPSGWIPLRSSCYFASSYNQASWSSAESYCRSHGGHLAQIDDVTEDTFVRGLAVLTGGEFVWLGATDSNHEGSWRSSSTGKTLSYIGQWAPGQPDNWGYQEHCLCLWRNHKYLWNDGTCFHRHPFVCEKSGR